MPTTLRAKSNSDLPFVFLNVAISADGKIAPANRRFSPFSTTRDFKLLLELRTRADAVMSGARTVDLCPVNLGPGGAKYRRKRLRRGLAEYNLRIVVSGAGSLDPGAEIFRHTFSPVIVLVTERAGLKQIARLKKLGAHVAVFGRTEIDFPAALRWLRAEWKVKTLLCEGGGEVNAALLRAGLVGEIYQTICPVIFGGRAAPTLADGTGIEKLSDAIHLQIKSRHRHGDELYLRWNVLAPVNQRGKLFV
ncbi:MAG: dihydrofolate reductase family protein [Verrucomicrobiota bacterium]